MSSICPGVWGAVVNFEKVGKKDDPSSGGGGGSSSKASSFIVDVLVNTEGAGGAGGSAGGSSGSSGPAGGASSAGGAGRSMPKLLLPKAKGVPQVVTFSLAQVRVWGSRSTFSLAQVRVWGTRSTFYLAQAATASGLESRLACLLLPGK